jgi:hypothetical protein
MKAATEEEELTPLGEGANVPMDRRRRSQEGPEIPT